MPSISSPSNDFQRYDCCSTPPRLGATSAFRAVSGRAVPFSQRTTSGGSSGPSYAAAARVPSVLTASCGWKRGPIATSPPATSSEALSSVGPARASPAGALCVAADDGEPARNGARPAPAGDPERVLAGELDPARVQLR